MKTILYATDCTERSVNALRYAHSLSAILEASLVVLHVYDIPPILATTTRPVQQIKRYAHRERLDILKAYCAKYLGNELDKKNVRIQVIENVSIADGILEKSKELLPDMVILGTKDEHTRRGLFAGDIAKALIEKVPCPLLAIPNNVPNDKIEDIVYATDFEEDDIFALKKIAKIAKPYNAMIRVIHITTKNEYKGEEQMEWFKEMLRQKVNYGNMTFDIIFSVNVYEELNAYLNNVGADLLAMLERGNQGFLRKLFHKDLVKKMESHITIPLLSFNKANL